MFCLNLIKKFFFFPPRHSSESRVVFAAGKKKKKTIFRNLLLKNFLQTFHAVRSFCLCLTFPLSKMATFQLFFLMTVKVLWNFESRNLVLMKVFVVVMLLMGRGKGKRWTIEGMGRWGREREKKVESDV